MLFKKVLLTFLLLPCPVVLDRGEKDCGSNYRRVMYAAGLLSERVLGFLRDEGSAPAVGGEEHEVDGTVTVYGRHGSTMPSVILDAMEVWAEASRVCCPRRGPCTLLAEDAPDQKSPKTADRGIRAELESCLRLGEILAGGNYALGSILGLFVVCGAVAVGFWRRRVNPDGSEEACCCAFGGAFGGCRGFLNAMRSGAATTPSSVVASTGLAAGLPAEYHQQPNAPQVADAVVIDLARVGTAGGVGENSSDEDEFNDSYASVAEYV